MNATFETPEAVRSGLNRIEADGLFSIELGIARRADQLARQRPHQSLLNLQCWLLAEAEFFGRSSDCALAHEATALTAEQTGW